jgi:hypothetical protein
MVAWSGGLLVLELNWRDCGIGLKVSRGIEPFSPMGTESADTRQPPNGKICIDKSHLLPNNPAQQQYRYTSVPIEAATG